MTYENYDNIANVLDYNAKPYLNGESSEGDSTAAFMDAINTGKPVYVPNAVGLSTAYDVALSALPDGFKLFGHSANPSASLSDYKSPTILKGISGASAIIDTSGVKSFEISGLSFDGLSRSMYGVGALTSTSYRGVLTNVTTRDCSTGIGGTAGNLLQAFVLTACVAHNNNFGFGNLVDGQVTQSTAIANLKSGFNLPSGCNRNTLLGNRVEWNNEFGVWCSDSEENLILGLMADRNGGAGVQISSGKRIKVTGNFSRNGRLYDAVNAQHLNRHIGLSGDWEGIDIDITTTTGLNDDSTGLLSPQHVLNVSGTGTRLRMVGMLDGSVDSMIGGSFDSAAKVSVLDHSGENMPFIQNMPYSVFQQN